jgi:hypothetical protein
MATRLDPETIERIASSFPSDGDWEVLRWADLRGDHGMNWQLWHHLHEAGAIYAIFLPHHHFAEERTIHLYSKRINGQPTTVEFAFRPVAWPLQGGRFALIYIGRTAGLLSRLKTHFRANERRTGGQVKHGLRDAQICESDQAASILVENEGVIAFHVLRGTEQTANRDIIEASLIAKYHPPFNIKAER